MTSNTGLAVPPERIWNICMLAHVDHGKSALSDSLVSSNGIISSRSAGKVRYMDSREDEQKRGITMKSSSIALGYRVLDDGPLHVVNLIDSPGHIDFTGEVEAALRMCDGALIVVDVVEGVCVQTIAVLRAALENSLEPLLVLNKVDRLFAELNLDPMEAYRHIVNIIEQVNVIMGVRQVEKMMAAASIAEPETEGEWQFEDTESGKPNKAISGYFSPEVGNVVFASAIDGWAFRVNDFAVILAKKFGISERVLNKTLWGDYYFQPKTKKIVKKKITDVRTKAKPMFVQLILSNLHSVYDTLLSTQHDYELTVKKRENFVSKLDLKVSGRDIRHRDASVALQAIMNAWLPASSCLMRTIIEKLPSAAVAQSNISRLSSLWTSPEDFINRNDSASSNNRVMVSRKAQFDAVSGTNTNKDVPMIAYIAKMIEGPDKSTNSSTQMNIRTPKSREEIERLKAEASSNDVIKSDVNLFNSIPMIAVARILSGSLSIGDTVYVYGPKYKPTIEGEYDSSSASSATITGLYLLMGRGLDPLGTASAGSVVGIAGLEDAVLKTATISTEPPGLCVPAVGKLSSSLGLDKEAVVKVAVEPHLLQDMEKLKAGLRRLNQADPAAETYVSAKGEHVLAAHGELHLERCLNDLRERFAKGIRIHVSKPIVSFRESVLGGISMNVTAEIEESGNREDSSKDSKKARNNDGLEMKSSPSVDINRSTKNQEESSQQGWSVQIEDSIERPDIFDTRFVRNGRFIRVGDNNVSFRTCAAPLPPRLAAVLDDASASLRYADMTKAKTQELIESVREKLHGAIREHAQNNASKKVPVDSIEKFWIETMFSRVWSSGPRHFGSNLLIGTYPALSRTALTEAVFQTEKKPERLRFRNIQELENAIITGFQLGIRSGPLCEEPMHGVAIFVDIINASEETQPSQDRVDNKEHLSERQIDLSTNDESAVVQADNFSAFSGLVIGSMKESVRLSLLHGNCRLMEGMLHVDISVPGDSLGKTYTVLGQRRGRVINEDMKEGVNVFGIEAYLPVQDSFGFTDMLRKQTSGFAVPQMVFSHWELLDIDPFWSPQTEEELEDLGASDTTAENNNLARNLINGVRRRKGLRVEEKIVENAEKQRTLSRKK